ncbi:ABC transporter substrate-binding protein [Terrarubrum flagellatum]|uniref:ABC transporter substrate-binding protein n=1 Tax=Terrirubrum flagellatum TaxID=2895980 RepID=UPI00314507DF
MTVGSFLHGADVSVMDRRRFVASSGAFTAALLGGGALAQTRKRVVIGTNADVQIYNPLVSNSRTDTWILQLMYPRLMQMDASGAKIPALAKSWGYDPDGLRARMTIRDDFTWSDGKKVTAEDVVFTVNAVAKEKIGVSGGYTAGMKLARAVSPTEIEFEFSGVRGPFLGGIGFWMPIVPAHIFSKAESVKAFANDKDWVSAGPYQLVSVEPGQRYVMRRTESYPLAAAGKANVEEIEFRVFPDVNSQALALRSGDLDMVATTLPFTLAKSLDNVNGLKVATVSSLGWSHILYNVRRAPLNKVEVRQALAYAVNPEAIRAVALQGQAKGTGSSALSPVIARYFDPGLKEYSYNPDKARQLLESAGFKKGRGGMYEGLSLSMIFDQADPYVSNWAQIVRDTSRDAGIDIKLSGSERNTWLQRARNAEFDLYAGNWSILEDPPASLDQLYRTGSFINYGGIADPELDKILDQCASALTPEAALAPVRAAAKLVHEKMYNNVLYVQEFNVAHNAKRVQDLEPRPSDLLSIINPGSLANMKLVG